MRLIIFLTFIVFAAFLGANNVLACNNRALSPWYCDNFNIGDTFNTGVCTNTIQVTSGTQYCYINDGGWGCFSGIYRLDWENNRWIVRDRWCDGSFSSIAGRSGEIGGRSVCVDIRASLGGSGGSSAVAYLHWRPSGNNDTRSHLCPLAESQLAVAVAGGYDGCQGICDYNNQRNITFVIGPDGSRYYDLGSRTSVHGWEYRKAITGNCYQSSSAYRCVENISRNWEQLCREVFSTETFTGVPVSSGVEGDIVEHNHLTAIYAYLMRNPPATENRHMFMIGPSVHGTNTCRTLAALVTNNQSCLGSCISATYNHGFLDLGTSPIPSAFYNGQTYYRNTGSTDSSDISNRNRIFMGIGQNGNLAGCRSGFHCVNVGSWSDQTFCENVLHGFWGSPPNPTEYSWVNERNPNLARVLGDTDPNRRRCFMPIRCGAVGSNTTCVTESEADYFRLALAEHLTCDSGRICAEIGTCNDVNNDAVHCCDSGTNTCNGTHYPDLSDNFKIPFLSCGVNDTRSCYYRQSLTMTCENYRGTAKDGNRADRFRCISPDDTNDLIGRIPAPELGLISEINQAVNLTCSVGQCMAIDDQCDERRANLFHCCNNPDLQNFIFSGTSTWELRGNYNRILAGQGLVHDYNRFFGACTSAIEAIEESIEELNIPDCSAQIREVANNGCASVQALPPTTRRFRGDYEDCCGEEYGTRDLTVCDQMIINAINAITASDCIAYPNRESCLRNRVRCYHEAVLYHAWMDRNANIGLRIARPLDGGLLDMLDPLSQCVVMPDGAVICKPSVLRGHPLATVVTQAVNSYVFPLAIIALFAMIVWGGLEVSIGGAKEQQNKIDMGKKRITAAVIGFVILFAAFWIIQLLGLVLGLDGLF